MCARSSAYEAPADFATTKLENTTQRNSAMGRSCSRALRAGRDDGPGRPGVHRRQRRWRKTESGGHHLSFGGGDKPEFDTGALLATWRDALAALLAVWDDCLRQFMTILE